MSVPLDRLPARETAALHDLVAVADALGVSLLLIGAIARQLVFDEPYGLPTRRTTRDLDFGVRVPDWATFQRLRNEAIDSKRFAPSTRMHTLIHQPTSLPIDLVPFGGLETHGVIRWPNEDTEMMVAGFDDAFEHAVAAEIAPGLYIRVVTVPLLAALKLFAFADRGSAFKKDIDDLLFIMEHYSVVTGVDRLYESPLDALACCSVASSHATQKSKTGSQAELQTLVAIGNPTELLGRWEHRTNSP